MGLGSFPKPKTGAKYSVTYNVKILEVPNSFCFSFKQCSFLFLVYRNKISETSQTSIVQTDTQINCCCCSTLLFAGLLATAKL